MQGMCKAMLGLSAVMHVLTGVLGTVFLRTHLTCSRKASRRLQILQATNEPATK
jgi:hypothetical protein